MSNPADKPEVVQLPAETPAAAPASNRRAAAQRVREARDRLTSTSGTRPAFDRELLRQYAQNPDVGVLCRDAAGGRDRPVVRFLEEPSGGGLDLRHALHPCRHHPQLRQIPRRAASLTATRNWRTRFVLLDLLYGLCWMAILIHPASPDVVSNTLMMFLMLLVIAVSSMLSASLPVAALAATVPVTAAIAAELRAGRQVRKLRARVSRARRGRLFRAARASSAFDDAGDAGGARRKGCADRRTRAGEVDIRRGAASRRIAPTSRSRGFWRK